MKQLKNSKAMLRAVGVVAAVVVIVSGVTFAALQSQQVKLTGSTIQTATANLQISPDGINYSSSHAGYSFFDLVPGGAAMPVNGYSFFLQNGGGTPLSLKFAISSLPSNPDNVDLTKVNIILTPNSGGSPQSITLAALIAANASGGITVSSPNPLMPGSSAQYMLQVSLAGDAVIGSSAALGNIDFAFTGVAQSN